MTENEKPAPQPAQHKMAFAFNNPAFADHILNIVVEPTIESEDSEDGATEGSQVAKRRKTNPPESGALNEGIPDQISEVARKLYVSSAVLASESPFFKSLFSNGMKESCLKEVKVLVSAEEVQPCHDLIKFIYCESFDTPHSVEKLFVTVILADRLGCNSAVNNLLQLLSKQQLSVEQCSQCLELPEGVTGSHPGFDKLLHGIGVRLSKIFGNIASPVSWDEEDFYQLPPRTLALLLSSDEIATECENIVFRILEAWIAKNPSDRHEYLGSLAPLLRYNLMDVDFLTDVVLTSPVGRRAIKPIADALAFHAFSPERKQRHLSSVVPRRKMKEAPDMLTYSCSLRLLRSRLEALSPTSRIGTKSEFVFGYWLIPYVKMVVDNNQRKLGISLRVDLNKSKLQQPSFYYKVTGVVYIVRPRTNEETFLSQKICSFHCRHRKLRLLSLPWDRLLDMVDTTGTVHIKLKFVQDNVYKGLVTPTPHHGQFPARILDGAEGAFARQAAEMFRMRHFLEEQAPNFGRLNPARDPNANRNDRAGGNEDAANNEGQEPGNDGADEAGAGAAGVAENGVDLPDRDGENVNQNNVNNANQEGNQGPEGGARNPANAANAADGQNNPNIDNRGAVGLPVVQVGADGQEIPNFGRALHRLPPRAGRRGQPRNLQGPLVAQFRQLVGDQGYFVRPVQPVHVPLQLAQQQAFDLMPYDQGPRVPMPAPPILPQGPPPPNPAPPAPQEPNVDDG